jgi:hypothetical protein
MNGQLKTVEAIREFALAGNARLTLVSKRTGARFTYRIRTAPGKPHFVSLLSGPDNNAHYTFLGTIFTRANGETYYRRGMRSKISAEALSSHAFTWVWDRISAGVHTADLEVWHEGRCGRCGRALTVPESIERGIGPECAGIIQKSRNFNLPLESRV